MPGALPIADLEHVLAQTAPEWEQMRGRRLFVSGGTGFFGRWLLESFLLANERLDLGAEALVLTRDAAAFLHKAPHLADRSALRFHEGDVRDFSFPPGKFDAIIHAATEASAKLNDENPGLMLETIVEGMKTMVKFARACGAGTMLLTSSGAVYGAQPPDLERTPEDFMGAPDVSAANAAYGEGKRVSELLGQIESRRGLKVKIARCYAFVGPGLPLDAHFAVGNFIRDALAGRPIVIQGDGTPVRSYLYAADLAVWLWKILFAGASGRPYNVGSAAPVSIAETAAAVARALGSSSRIIVNQQPVPGRKPARYVPETTRAERELGLRAWIGLDEGIRRTAQWNKNS
ncbi:MAG TPA: NAD-dependent epimerase/dehydratase family protein [Verrucomicrobiae bacterium]|jgi:dTDP-glucose 4,6-dehydratase|nr:NAD-dependent epimerase/dehydratase family protein [Verrucomicrobiae bacterium]